MQTSLRVTLHNLPTSAELEESIRERVAKLERLSPHLVSCHVVLETPHRRTTRGKQVHVRLDIRLSGAEISLHHDSDSEIHTALSNAFDAAERTLRERRGRDRAKPKTMGEAA
jgi:ribosomal subunit interface protein